MEIVLAAAELGMIGGVQTYLLTVGPQLERLGHGVTIYAAELGHSADLVRARGLRLAETERDLPASCDLVLSQDGITALLMAERYPEARRGMVVHGADSDMHLPPVLDGTVSVAIAMNGIVERRLMASAATAIVARLRQPIDIARLRPVGAVRERPRSALLFGNYLTGRRRDEVIAGCERADLEWREVGRYGEMLDDPAAAIAAADIVIGQGRCVLEAMACGRAAIVLGPSAGDGWVTADSYPAIEADGFRGRANGTAAGGADALGVLLTGYRASMATVNRELAVSRHSAYEHVVELVEVMEAAPQTPAADAPLREMARLVRSLHDGQARLIGAQLDLAGAHTELAKVHDDYAQLHSERERLAAANAQLHDELQAERRRWFDLVRSRRWRLATRLTRPLDRLRERL